MKRNHLRLVKSSKVNEDKRSRKLAIIKRKSEKLILHPLFMTLPMPTIAKYMALHHNTDNIVWTATDLELMDKGLDRVLTHMGKIKPHQVTGLKR